MCEALPPLGDDVIVYRALTRVDHLDVVRHKALPDAFIRRPEKDEDGLSLSLDPTPKLKKWRGVARLTVGQIRQLGLIVELDPNLENHVLIKGLPLQSEHFVKAE